jgi:hypothetical protein
MLLHTYETWFASSWRQVSAFTELLPMKKEHVDFVNAAVWIPDLKTPDGVSDLPLTKLALTALRDPIAIFGKGKRGSL